MRESSHPYGFQKTTPKGSPNELAEKPLVSGAILRPPGRGVSRSRTTLCGSRTKRRWTDAIYEADANLASLSPGLQFSPDLAQKLGVPPVGHRLARWRSAASSSVVKFSGGMVSSREETKVRGKSRDGRNGQSLNLQAGPDRIDPRLENLPIVLDVN